MFQIISILSIYFSHFVLCSSRRQFGLESSNHLADTYSVNQRLIQRANNYGLDSNNYENLCVFGPASNFTVFNTIQQTQSSQFDLVSYKNKQFYYPQTKSDQKIHTSNSSLFSNANFFQYLNENDVFQSQEQTNFDQKKAIQIQKYCLNTFITFVVLLNTLITCLQPRSSTKKIQTTCLCQTSTLLIILALIIDFSNAGGNDCKPKYSGDYDDETQGYLDSSSDYTAPEFNSFENCQSDGQCTYSATITPDASQDTSFIQFNSNSRKISWTMLYSKAQIGVYEVSVHCNYCVNNGNSGTQSCDKGTEKFVLTITDYCNNSTIISVTAPDNASDSVFTSSGSSSASLDDFKVNKLSGCESNDIQYSVVYSPTSPQILSYSESDNTINWSNPLVAGVYTAQITATVSNSVVTVSKTCTFELTVKYTCQDDINEVLTLTAPTSQELRYPAFGPSSSQSIGAFTFTASLGNCVFGNIQFTTSKISKTTGQTTSLITISNTNGNYITTWSSPTLSQVDEYLVTVYAKITNGRGTVEASYVLTLTIFTPTCYESQEIFTISKGSNPPVDQSYIVRGTQGSITFNEFTETSSVCTISDILYQVTITPPSGKGISFINVSSDKKQISWQTSLASDAGEYTILLQGSILTQYFGSKSASTSFKLTVFSCWYNYDSITITTSNIGPITTKVNEAGQSQNVVPFQQNSIHCIDSEIAYTYSVEVPQSQSTNFIKFDSTTFQIIWSSPTEAGIYTVTVTGTIENKLKKNTASTNFVLTVYSCATSVDSITIHPVDISPFVQNVNTDGSSVIVEMYDLTSYACVKNDISYTSYISSDQLQSTNFITFNHLTRTITWTSPTEAGVYEVKVEGFIIQESGTISRGSSIFKLTVYSCASSIDEMQLTASVLSPVTQNSGTSGSSIDVPEFLLVSGSCFLTDIIYTATINADQSQSTSFITFSSSSMKITWSSPTYAGVYTVSVLGKVTNTFGLASATLTFVLTVIQTATWVPPTLPVVNTTNTSANATKSQETKAKNTTAQTVTKIDSTKVSTFQYKIEIPELTPEQIILPNPYWKGITVSNQGVVKITFSEKFIIPPHLEQIDSTILDVKLIPFGTTDKKYYNYTWNVTEYTNTYFVIQLNFTSPLYISSQGKNYYDKIQVTALEPIFFTSKTSFKSILQDSQIKKDIPPQLSSNQAANQALDGVTKTLDSASKIASTGSFIANLLMSSSLSLLWGMINAIQIIAHLPYFNMMTPANAQMFYQFMVNLANFKILPLDTVYRWLGISDEDEQKSEQRVLQDLNVTSSAVTQAENENSNLFKNLGPIFLILYLAAFGLVLLVILIFLQRFQRIKSITQSILKKIKLMLFWNSTTRYIMESYLNTTLQTFLYLQVTNPNSLFSTDNWKSTVYALIALTIFFSAPLIVNIYLRHRIYKFRNKPFLERFNAIIDNFNWRYHSCANFISIFCYRRLILVLLIVYFQDYPYAQVQVMTVSCILVIVLFGYSNVYFIPKDRNLEYFNEATILLCVYHFYLFTDFVADAQSRYTIGYSLIVATCLNFGVNVILMVLATLQKIIILFKKFKQQYRLKQYKKRIIKLNQEQLQQVSQQNTNHNEEQQNLFEQKHIEMPYVLEEQQLEQQRMIEAQKRKEERALKRKMRRLEAQKQFEVTKLKQEMAQISEVDSEYEIDTKSSKQKAQNLKQLQDSVQIKEKRFLNFNAKVTQHINIQPQIGSGGYYQVSQLISEDLEQESNNDSSKQVQNEIYALNKMIESQLEELQDLNAKS